MSKYADTSKLRFGSVQNLVLELETRPRTEQFRSHDVCVCFKNGFYDTNLTFAFDGKDQRKTQAQRLSVNKALLVFILLSRRLYLESPVEEPPAHSLPAAPNVLPYYMQPPQLASPYNPVLNTRGRTAGLVTRTSAGSRISQLLWTPPPPPPRTQTLNGTMTF